MYVYTYIYIYREIPALTMVLAMFRALTAFFLGYTGGGDKAGYPPAGRAVAFYLCCFFIFNMLVVRQEIPKF